MPRREPSAYVWDVLDACRSIVSALKACDRDAYLADDVRRLAVERLLITIGEAMSQLAKADPAMASELGDVAQIVAFRNILVHGYHRIDHAQVWAVLTVDLPRLHAASERVWGRFAHLYELR
jgi:uncharacterized protein with HEPN domain